MAPTFATDQEKAEALNHSRPFDVHKWSDFPEVNAAVEKLYGELKDDPDFGNNERLNKKHIKVVVLDLYAAWLADPDLYIAYDRSPNAYKGNSRYNRLHISFLTVGVVDALIARRYVEHHLGHHSRDGSRFSHLSRMRATDRLIKLIKDDHKVPAKAITTYKGTECIILRDILTDEDGEEYKADIEYDDTRETNRMRKRLLNYNALLGNSIIEITDTDDDYVTAINGVQGILINYPGSYVRRVFNNGSWSDGGRFFGGWWQQIPGKIRRRIRINNASERCPEIDYSGLHIVMLYAMEGIAYWKEDGADPYELDGYDNTERMRQLLKLVLLISINAKTKSKAVGAVRKEVNFDDDTFGWIKREGQIDIGGVIDAFATRHKPIRKHLFSGGGIKLQNIDSKIAELVINHFTDKSIVVLCIHDSFLIEPKHENELIKLMNESFTKIMNGYTTSEVDINATMKHQSMYSDLLKE